MKDFDVVIATSNRPKSLRILVEQILIQSLKPQAIIVIDSSDRENNNLDRTELLQYHHTNIKNQPLQRYKGYLRSTSEIIFFFDDDMRISNKDAFRKILENFETLSVVGVQPNFSYKNKFFDNDMPISVLRTLAKKNSFFKFLKFLSGNPVIHEGKFWLAGIRGPKPSINGDRIEWFNGPVFCARRNFLYKNFNFNLFNIYSKKLGKGEDAILGFTLSQSGEIIFHKENLFFHDDYGDSSYTKDFSSYAERTVYSRLYLSYEYSRIRNKSKLVAFLHFNLFISSRIISLIFNQIVSYKKDRNGLIIGSIVGYIKANFSCFKIMRYKDRL